jgi:hypothetical protein
MPPTNKGAQTERESKLMDLIRKMMGAMQQQRGQQGGQMSPNLQGGQGGQLRAPAAQSDPTTQAMQKYLQKAMMEAQQPQQPPQGGSATVQPSGGGQSTIDTMGGKTQADDIERQMNGG